MLAVVALSYEEEAEITQEVRHWSNILLASDRGNSSKFSSPYFGLKKLIFNLKSLDVYVNVSKVLEY